MLVREGAERVTQLPHQDSGLDAASRDVPDGEVEDAVGPADRVVPVPAHLEPDAARVVPAAELEAVDGRQSVGKQAPLERDGDVVLALVAAGPRQGSGRVLRVRDHKRLVGIVERLIVREERRVTDPIARPLSVSRGNA